MHKSSDGMPLNHHSDITKYSSNEPTHLSGYLREHAYENNNVCGIMSNDNVALSCKGYDDASSHNHAFVEKSTCSTRNE